MPVTYKYDAALNVVFVKATGIVTVNDILVNITNILNDKAIKRDFLHVVDYENASDLIVAVSEMPTLRDMWLKYVQKGVQALMVHVPSEETYGLFRQLKAYITMGREDTEPRFVLVRSKEELVTQIKEVARRLDQTK